MSLHELEQRAKELSAMNEELRKLLHLRCVALECVAMLTICSMAFLHGNATSP